MFRFVVASTGDKTEEIQSEASKRSAQQVRDEDGRKTAAGGGEEGSPTHPR